ncbi:MAG: UDP-N-acetylmuramate dehydrogenase [Muribaculaceae bacterium]|nr:UDP-N-acetylmuramate dehydrogenase [Muribaculaceae bacterium]
MINIRENISLKPYHTFGMDVTTRYFAEYDSVEDLRSLLISPILKDNIYLQIGGGSNLLFTKDYPGIILHSRITKIDVTESDDSVILKVGAGVVWDDFVAYVVSNNWYGAENLSYIPGEIGASAVQNVGAYGVEAKDIIERVYAVDVETGAERIFTKEECQYGYRSSIFKTQLKGQYIITYVEYKLSKAPLFKLEYGNLKTIDRDGLTLQKVRDSIIEIRKQKLPEPKEIGSAGSFFINPVVDSSLFEKLRAKYPSIVSYPQSNGRVKLSAAWLIDNAGWHGKRVGGAAVYPKQCLVLINENNAKPSDVIELASKIKNSVFEKYGVEITPEVNYI